ncbi:MAG: hypothetical protein AAF703_05260 [Cyanobacteria bacterium P01_D01_bin.105]
MLLNSIVPHFSDLGTLNRTTIRNGKLNLRLCCGVKLTVKEGISALESVNQ